MGTLYELRWKSLIKELFMKAKHGFTKPNFPFPQYLEFTQPQLILTLKSAHYENKSKFYMELQQVRRNMSRQLPYFSPLNCITEEDDNEGQGFEE